MLPLSLSIATVLLSALAPTAPQAGPETKPLDAALRLVPGDATAFVLVVNPKATSDDLQQCIDRMNLAEAAIAGRPIDQVKAAFGLSAAFDDHGPAALIQLPATAGAPAPFVALVPTTDAAQFLKGNFTQAQEQGPDAWRTKDGTTLFAKAVDHHVVLSTDADAARRFAPAGGIAQQLRERLGPRGRELLVKGDIVAWAGPAAMKSMFEAAAARMDDEVPADAPFAAQAREMRDRTRKLLAGAEDALLIADIDPLGLSLRTWGRFAAGSEMASLMAGGKERRSAMDRLPQLPFYFAMRVDVQGLGGIAALESVLKAMPGEPALPAWLVSTKDQLQGMQFAVYPSKMGVATGGLLNDSLLFLESDKPEAVRDALRQAVMATAGDAGGLRREPTWTADKQLKSGDVADAFEVKETLLADAPDAKPADLAMQRLVTQLVYGSRGFVGFVRPVSDGVLMTFSQRTDVLNRALSAPAQPKSLANDGTLVAYRDWLIEGADVEGFIGVGQFGKLIQQVAAMVPGGDGARLPQIPTSVEPVAFAFEVDAGTLESALVIPTGVLTLFYNQARSEVLGTGGGQGPGAASGENRQPDKETEEPK